LNFEIKGLGRLLIEVVNDEQVVDDLNLDESVWREIDLRLVPVHESGV